MDTLTKFLILLGLVIVVLAIIRFFQRKPRGSGIYKRTLQPGGWRYGLYLPENYQVGDQYPVVIVLHYGGHGAAYYGYEMLLELVLPAYKDLGAILAAPDCPAVSWEHPDSERLVLDLIDHLVEEFGADPEQVALCGYSMGAIGVWHLLRHHSERFSAGVALAGLPPRDALEVNWQVPMYVIHSRADERMPLVNTLSVVNQLQKMGLEIRVLVIETFTHSETRRYITPLRETAFWLKGIWEKN